MGSTMTENESNTLSGSVINSAQSSDDLQAFECQEANDRPLLENNQYLDDSEDIDITRKHSPRVTVPESGRLMYKATLTSLLNQDPNLSHDRLERVRQRQEYSTEEQPRMHAGGQAALFEDYAVLDRPNSCFRLGNLVRLVFSGNHGPVEYGRPVSYEDPQKSKITAFLQF
ncbi:uncharacterized protein [Montipora capricornis]|uniref:uncharacterized protein n=1 Tax=Montipora capricornis TaxID=246305 RepID=UPI0035F13A26